MRQAIDRHVGVRLRAFRLHRGWTQGELAARLGMSGQQIHKYETGANRISAGMLYGFSQVLAVEIAAFFAGVETHTLTPSPSYSPSPRPSPIKGEGEKGDDSGVVIANAVKQSRSRTGADPCRVIASRADNPDPSTRALKIAMALEAIPNPGLKAAIADLIAFAAGLRG